MLRNFDLKKIQKTVTTIKKDGLKSVFAQKTTYLAELKPKKGWWKFGIAVFLIVVILVSIFIFKYQRNVELRRIQSLLQPIQVEVASAKELAVTDPITARETVTAQIEKISQLEKENQTSSSVELFTQAKSELSAYLESISGREELQELSIFYDLRLAKSDFISSGIDLSGKTLIIYDSDMKQLLLLDSETKRVFVRSFVERERLRNAVINDQAVFVLVDGVYKFVADFNSQTELQVVRELGDSNRNATLIDAYDRFVYVINPEKRNIYRYAQTDEGYSDPVGWMKSATGLQYDELRSISVDGDVWLTTSNGQLKKFTSGHEETFVIRGLQVPFEKDIYAYTNETLENVYMLDPANNRIVVVNKTGDFVKEIKSVSLGAASNLAVSEALGKIFVISGSIVYQIEL